MSDQQKHIKHYSLAEIERYLQGKLSPSEMHELEKAALQDPFLADAIEGYHSTEWTGLQDDLFTINNQLSSGLAKIISAPGKKNISWKIAASIILLAGIGVLGWQLLIKNNNNKQELALQQSVHQLTKDTVQTTLAKINKKEPDKRVEKTALAIFPKNQPLRKKFPASMANIDRNTDAIKNVLKDTMLMGNNTTANSVSLFLAGRVAGVSVQQYKTTRAIKPGDNFNMQKQHIANASLSYAGTVKNTGVLITDSSTRTVNNITALGNVYSLAAMPVMIRGYSSIPAGDAPLFVVDGSPYKGDIAAINPNDIESVTILKDTAAIALYGPSASKGAILLTTKKNLLAKIYPSNQPMPKESGSTLDEVVVVGYGTSKKKDVTGSVTHFPPHTDETIPKGGWLLFTGYLEKKISSHKTKDSSLILHGSITVELTLKNGKALKAAITQTFNDTLNRILIHAIQNGPEWISSVVPGQKGKRTVNFTL